MHCKAKNLEECFDCSVGTISVGDKAHFSKHLQDAEKIFFFKDASVIQHCPNMLKCLQTEQLRKVWLKSLLTSLRCRTVWTITVRTFLMEPREYDCETR